MPGLPSWEIPEHSEEIPAHVLKHCWNTYKEYQAHLWLGKDGWKVVVTHKGIDDVPKLIGGIENLVGGPATVIAHLEGVKKAHQVVE